MKKKNKHLIGKLLKVYSSKYDGKINWKSVNPFWVKRRHTFLKTKYFFFTGIN